MAVVQTDVYGNPMESEGFLSGLASKFGFGGNTGSSINGLGMTGGVLGGLSTLGNTFLGYKQYGLAKDAFNFNKDMKEKEYTMAKDAYDRNVTRANSVGSQMQAGSVPTPARVG